MGRYVALETLKLVARAGRSVIHARVLVLGVTFKENVRDVRNSRSLELTRDLGEYGFHVFAHDPMLQAADLRDLGLAPVTDPFHGPDRFDALVLAVPHRAYRDTSTGAFVRLLSDDGRPGVIVDVHGVLDRDRLPPDRILYWRL